MVKMLKSLSNAYHLARLQETTNNLMKGMTKASFFHNFCVKDSREVMDEVDGKKFVENGFKLIQIEEKARKSSELESNMSCKVDVDGMANCEEDGEDHEIKSSEVVNNNIDLKNLVEVIYKLISIDSREVMDEFDGKKFVKNRFKLNKIDESQVDVHCLEESIMYFDKEDYEIESSEVVDNNIDSKNLVEVSKEGDKDEEMSSKDLSRDEDNNTCFVEMTTVVANIGMSVTNFQYNKAYHILENQDNKEDDGVKCNEEVRNFINGVAGMEIDSGRNGDSNSDAMGVDDVVINLSKEDVNRDSYKEVKNIKEYGGKQDGNNKEDNELVLGVKLLEKCHNVRYVEDQEYGNEGGNVAT
ncbi:hypothetical protein Tco_0876111 [Tanacetum coccineum]|uniref:Uncharacterized protein n=1 Tax=Tanacetum coccineum TaxID=301880 RepID=A0ABQ5BRI4_9ASTR